MGYAAERKIIFSLRKLASRASKKGRQVAISFGSGLFSGGAQRTAFVIMQSTSFRPSSGRA